MIDYDDTPDDIDTIRYRNASLLSPGMLVVVSEHKIAGMEYDYVRMWQQPLGTKRRKTENTHYYVYRGLNAVIIATHDVKYDDRWVMLLCADGSLGWTHETEGLVVR